MSASASTTVTISNRLGLHARPAMMFVEAASQFQSRITVSRIDQGDRAEQVDGKSIMQMMMLAATCGTELRIDAEGDDAAQALDELAALVNAGFAED